MSKLEELIKELCPNGVKYINLVEVTDIHKGIQFNKKEMAKEGSYPVINGGIEPSGYVEVYNEREDTITIQLSDNDNGTSYEYTIPLIFSDIISE